MRPGAPLPLPRPRPVAGLCLVAVVDQRPLMGDALAGALMRRDLDVIATYDRLSSVTGVSSALWPHVVILSDGLTPLTRRLLPDFRRTAVDVSVVVISGGEPEVSALFAAGMVDAVLGPDAGVERLLRAVRRVRSGGRFDAGGETTTRGPLVELTTREAEVLRLLAAGRSNERIAAGMGISVNTVRSHVQAVLRKLGAERRLEAVRRAGELGLLESLSA